MAGAAAEAKLPNEGRSLVANSEFVSLLGEGFEPCWPSDPNENVAGLVSVVIVVVVVVVVVGGGG